MPKKRKTEAEKLLVNSREAFERIKAQQAKKNLSPEEIRVPVLSGKALNRYIQKTRRRDEFYARSLSNAFKVVHSA